MGGRHFREFEGLRQDIVVYIHMPYMIYERRQMRDDTHVHREVLKYEAVISYLAFYRSIRLYNQVETTPYLPAQPGKSPLSSSHQP